jgi:hypothetical protein
VQFNQQHFPMFQEQFGGQPNNFASMKKKQVKPIGNKKEGSQNSSTPMQQERSVGGPPRGVDNGLMFDQRLKDVVCYNCGEPDWRCLATQLGTPRGRYDEHSGKFPSL